MPKSKKSTSEFNRHTVLPLCIALRKKNVLVRESPLTGKSYEHRRGWVEQRLVQINDEEGT